MESLEDHRNGNGSNDNDQSDRNQSPSQSSSEETQSEKGHSPKKPGKVRLLLPKLKIPGSLKKVRKIKTEAWDDVNSQLANDIDDEAEELLELWNSKDKLPLTVMHKI